MQNLDNLRRVGMQKLEDLRMNDGVSNSKLNRSQLPRREIMRQAYVAVLPVTFVMIALSWLDFFSNATVELGLGHYAERRPPWFEGWFTGWIPMPLNTLVNFSYVWVGYRWAQFFRQCHCIGIVNCNDLYLFFMFYVMTVSYACIQLTRILFQTRATAVIDQWYTLPCFMFVYVTAQNFRGKLNRNEFFTLMLLSIFSYSLTFFTQIGFEIALGCHIVLATVGAVLVYQDFGTADGKKAFAKALLSCAGFVILKLLDHRLAEFHWIFVYISGHFLSKICDVLQMYYVNEFFFNMVLGKSCKKSDDQPNIVKLP